MHRTLLSITLVVLLLAPAPARASDLLERTAPTDNPGDLEMFSYAPQGAPSDAPLVVVLHGCGQTADDYVSLAGWQELADEYEFLLLAPQQRETNNFARCFNWFATADNARGEGEARSIRNMVAQIAQEEGTAPDRVFITGLSAGGFMTTAMLATYPEVFAAGAVLAGGPFGCASSALGASSCMNGLVSKDAATWASLVQSAAPATGGFPRISIWHGRDDTTVHPNTSDELVKQWTALHGVAATTPEIDNLAGHARVRYGSPVVVEAIALNGIGHAVAVAPSICGAVGAYAEDAGVCSSLEIAHFWGLTGPSDTGDAGPERDAGFAHDATPGVGDDAGSDEGSSPGGCSAGCGVGGQPRSGLALFLVLLGALHLRRRIRPSH